MIPAMQTGSSPGLTLEQIRVCILVERDLPVLNISQNGLAVVTQKPLTMGQIYSLQLTSDGQSVTLDGEVARCNLNEISETSDGHQAPTYLNGIKFQMSRNPLELSLLDILHANMTGEKRRTQRIKPLHTMMVDIGHPCFTRVRSFKEDGILLQSTELIDLDLEWRLMVQTLGRSMVMGARVLHASKKSGEATYGIQVEFTDLNDVQKTFLDLVVSRLEEALNPDT